MRRIIIGLCALAALLFPAAAGAARLVGGRQQTKLDHAFFAHRAHRGQVIVSTRASTVAPAWAAIRSVRPERAGRTTPSGRTPRLQRTYLHRVKGRYRSGKPPARVRADLSADLRVEVVYRGSGSESIAYKQATHGVCPGAGGFIDTQQVTVRPMSWTVRYVVDLDRLQSAVRGPTGPVVVVESSFDRAGSSLSARETLTRTVIDHSCNGQPTTFHCDAEFGLGPASQGLLSFPATGGLEIGVPIASKLSGDCNPSDFTLGPSLWDGGGATAVVSQLRLPGGRLPVNPYAPVAVSWPKSSPALAAGAPVSPCQGDAAACRDTFRWSGHVSLQNAR